MNAPEERVHATDLPVKPDFWFVLPPGFTVVDLTENQKDRMGRISKSIDGMLPDVPQEKKFRLVISSEMAIQAIKRAGAVHFSQCLYRTDSDQLAQATLTVYLENTGPRDRSDTVGEVSRRWVTENPASEVGVVNLPYGPAALCTHDISCDIPREVYDIDSGINVSLRQLKLCVPLANGTHSAVFVLATEDTSLWDDYVKLMIEVSRSFSYNEPTDIED